ncbi:hypothetical protein IMZ31_22885 (plasmid) [Pontibacillus sp. ALD_SL1]|uniref:hypothetical protein n=1 Tax=Pontibacillus sp. ALD_SL1 TaxID=2777185 RepID=UPI001A96B220|nr:hypothetical protein [Pontibacillus sp. ALD_SL1]QST02302.1 hypothetical protein IMZ31_22885 [Pontibacillus sp. ALD_SL1]
MADILSFEDHVAKKQREPSFNEDMIVFHTCFDYLMLMNINALGVKGRDQTLQLFEADKDKFQMYFYSVAADLNLTPLIPDEDLPEEDPFGKYPTFDKVFMYFIRKRHQQLTPKRQ